MNILKLLVREIADRYVQENFIKLNEFFRANTNWMTFKHLEITITQVSDQILIPHGLSFAPKDIVITSVLGPGLVGIQYDQFDRTNICLAIISGTASKAQPVTVRCYVGTHVKGDL
jgi:hypothetical protein